MKMTSQYIKPLSYRPNSVSYESEEHREVCTLLYKIITDYEHSLLCTAAAHRCGCQIMYCGTTAMLLGDGSSI